MRCGRVLPYSRTVNTMPNRHRQTLSPVPRPRERLHGNATYWSDLRSGLARRASDPSDGDQAYGFNGEVGMRGCRACFFLTVTLLERYWVNGGTCSASRSYGLLIRTHHHVGAALSLI